MYHDILDHLPKLIQVCKIWRKRIINMKKEFWIRLASNLFSSDPDQVKRSIIYLHSYSIRSQRTMLLSRSTLA